MASDSYNIKVDVETQYVEEQSLPQQDRYVFAYTITIRNQGTVPAQLLTRHWIITDANNKVQEVKGEGVVGEQPHLKPGEQFRYTSGTVIATPVGSMHGSYGMVRDDGRGFDYRLRLALESATLDDGTELRNALGHLPLGMAAPAPDLFVEIRGGRNGDAPPPVALSSGTRCELRVVGRPYGSLP